MQRECDACGRGFESKTVRARFCSETCKKRGQRGAGGEGLSGVVAATEKALNAAERSDSPLGASALALARRIESGRDTGSGLASLNREWRATLDGALAGAKAASALDELRERRLKRLGA